MAVPGSPLVGDRGRDLRPLIPLVSLLSLAVLGAVGATTWIAATEPFNGLFWVPGSGAVIGVFPGSPAAAAGIRPGAVIVTIGGSPTSSVRRSTAAASSLRVGDTLGVTVLQDGAARSVELEMVDPASRLVRLGRLEAPLIALCFELLGFVVWARKPHDRTVLLFLLFSYATAVLLAAGAMSALGQRFGFLAFILLLSVWSAVAVHFHLVFPRPRRVDRRLCGGLYALACIPPMLYLPGLGQAADLEWYVLSSSTARASCAGAALAVAALLVHTYRTTPSPEERLRIRLVVFGTVLACAPTVGLSLLPGMISRHRPVLVPYELTLPFLLLIPVSYVLAIQRYDLLRVERLAHRGVVHIVVFAMLVGLYVVLAAGLLRLAPWADAPLVRGLTVVPVALLFGPLRRRLEQLADRVVYGGWYDYRSILADVTRDLAGLVDAGALAELLGRRLPRILHVEGAALLLPGGEKGLEEVASSGWASGNTPPTLDRGGALGQALARASLPMTTLELAATAEDPSDEEQAWLTRPGIELWVPLVQRDVLQGLLLLGAKPGGEPFDTEDRRLLGTLAWSAAVAVENVRLFSALRRRADEVNRLYSQLLQSREVEQKRIARELHDGVIQDLVNLHYLLDMDPAEGTPKATIASMRQGLRDVVDKLRQVSTELRPSALDDLSLGLAVRGYVEEARSKYRLKISLRLPASAHDPLEALPEEVRIGLFRVLQEAIHNVHRHARANRVDVSLVADDVAVTLEVHDDGQGFRCPTELGALIRRGHFGLAGAQERMSLVGGRLELTSAVGRGTTLRASVPLGPPARGA